MSFHAVSHFAQTWGLVYLLILFAGALFYALRPGAKAKFKDAAEIPLRED